MKKFFLTCVVSFFCAATLLAQTNLPSLDKSPMDESYCPNNYPLLRLQGKASDPLVARIIYSRPQKNGRVIFGNLIEYGTVWRLGANEATEIEFFQPVKMGDIKIKKGRYTLYAVPREDKWTIIVNKETDIWGSFMYHEKNDVARMDILIQKQAEITEVFTITFDKSEKGYDLQFYWDDVKVSVPITL